MKIYTRTGDDGRTGLFGGERVSKAHPRVEAYGTLDELNAAIGVAIAQCDEGDLVERLLAVQRRLFDLGADVATPPESPSSGRIGRADERWVRRLEDEIDEMTAELPPLRAFVLPGGTAASAALHHARTICRRAERRLAAAAEDGAVITPAVRAYVNRLSDWLFTAARLANSRAGVPDTPWRDAQAQDQDPSPPQSLG